MTLHVEPSVTTTAQIIAADDVPSMITDESTSPVKIALGNKQRVLLYTADALTLTAGPILAATALRALDPSRAGYISIVDVIIAAVGVAVAMHLHGLYRRPASRLLPTAWWRPTVVLRCLPTAALLMLATSALIIEGPRRLTITSAVVMALPAAVLVPIGRRMIVRLFGAHTVSRILILGTGQVADRVTARLRRCPDTAVVGYVDDSSGADSIVGNLKNLPSICRDLDVDRIIVAFSRTPSHEVLQMVRRLNGAVPVSVVPRFYELLSWRSEVEELHGLPLVHVAPAELRTTQRVGKRILDLVVGGLAALLLILPCLVAALAIKLDGRGPVFFRQERIGRSGEGFRIFKFRTMTTDADARKAEISGSNESDGPLFKMAADPRVTRVGSFLRKTSIDELPQLINVLRGEMSLVGPRPLPTDESARLDGAALTRFDVAPGMTGLWQVSGRSDLSYADLQHLDSVYVRSWSLLWDMKIIIETPRSVLGGRGAY